MHCHNYEDMLIQDALTLTLDMLKHTCTGQTKANGFRGNGIAHGVEGAPAVTERALLSQSLCSWSRLETCHAGAVS